MTRVCWIGCVTVLLGMGSPRAAPAQSPADAYFHEAAQQYVADEVQAARQTVKQGLEVAPSNPRLLALRKKLQQGGRPDNRQNQQDSSSAGSKKGTNENGNPSPESSSKGGTEPSSKQGGAARSGPQEAPESNQTGAPSSRQRSGGRPDRTDAEQQGRKGQPVDSLSRAQAKRLLQALEGQERRLLRQLRPRSTARRTVEKDW